MLTCREQVQIPAVVSEKCGMVSSKVGFPEGKTVGYIKISTFNKKTGDLFTQQLNDLKQEGVDAFVLDIRNNGGGYFPAGVQACSNAQT
jgi:carboxyl-terminal processing protease